ncbi:uncharacterized protein LOC143544483 [Bidens hawaiensis]|uniref:uncharacterized protein LOC143544483 n=1 Tax=Bidens hawaiensis TaxID=980011 RepID=UPI00404B940D
MAGTAAASILPPPPTTAHISASSLPSSFTSRTRRTNHLRKKILKTLENKPYPDPHIPLKPITIPIQETLQPVESDQFSVSESPGFVDSVFDTFSTRSVTKIGLYLVGAFIFQTVCAVMIFGSQDLDDKDENLIEKKSNLLLSQNQDSNQDFKQGIIGMKSGDGLEIDNRIIEIQEMARRAREQERVEGKRKGLVEEEDEDGEHEPVDQTVKKKEIDDRLNKLRKSLEVEYQKPGAKVSRNEDGVGNDVDEDLLMFKKKYKFKSPSDDSGDKPKGFGGIKDVDVANGTAINGVSDSTLNTDEVRETKTESIAGTSKEPKYDNQTSKAEKSGKSSNLETKKSRGFGKESSDAAITAKQDNNNGSLKGKKGGIKRIARTQTNFWWTSLPVVMAVGMQRRNDGEGLFSIKNASGLQHVVAFEDRSDATNLAYLLESVFEDLQDFSTNITPLLTNEVEQDVKSQKMKVVVVKKGQLKLYVGQPLEDVKSALRALIDQQSE